MLFARKRSMISNLFEKSRDSRTNPFEATGDNIKRFIWIIVQFAIIAAIPATTCFAQGSIYGTVRNSDMSTPAKGGIYFMGFLDSTDEEIRIENCIGAGYDSGNWFDDFQNYLTEAPGNPYDYYFYNPANGEAATLAKTIPGNSFQQEDIQLSPMTFPGAPGDLSGRLLNDSAIQISWSRISAFTYRVYRRMTGSEGSFFRIDDITGSLSNPGVSDSIFVDSSVNHVSAYDYMIIPVDGNIFGLHSVIISVNSVPDYFLCGDANGNGLVNIQDVTYIINFLYRHGPAPNPSQAADVNGNGIINIQDMTYLVNFLYRGGPAPNCP
jgi:Dockerin type I domain